MSQELILQNKDLTQFSEDELLKVWRSQRGPVQKRNDFNSVYVDNVKLSDDGELNPDFGKIFLVKYERSTDNDEVKEIKTELKVGQEFYPVLVRVQVSSREWTAGDDGVQRPAYNCREVEMGEDIEVYDLAEKRVVFTGPYQDAKQAYKLKWQPVVYIECNGDVYRWKLNCGETITNWFAINRDITRKNCPYTIKVSKVVAENNKSIFWNNIFFMLGSPYKIMDALQLQLRLQKELSDSSYESEDAPEDPGEKGNDVDELAEFNEDQEKPKKKAKPYQPPKSEGRKLLDEIEADDLDTSDLPFD